MSAINGFFDSIRRTIAKIFDPWGGQRGNNGPLRYLLPGTEIDWEKDAGDFWVNGVVAACLAWYQDNFLEPELEVVRKVGANDYEPIEGHPALDLIYEPNEDDDEGSIFDPLVLSFMCDGNGHWLKGRARSRKGPPKKLWYVPHFECFPRWPTDGSMFISHYDIEPTNTGQAFSVAKEDVIHFRWGKDPRNPRYGRSPLKAMVREIVGDNEASTYTATIVKNMGIPSLIISPEDRGAVADPTTMEDIKRRLTRDVGGDSRGDVLVFNEPYKAQELSLSPEKLALDRIRQVPEDRICAAMRLNAMVAGVTAGAAHKTYANYEEANRAAYTMGLIPLQRRIATTLTRHLLRDFDPDPNLCFRWNYKSVAALRENMNDVMVRMVSAYQGDIITKNEAREACGFEPIEGEDGDLFMSEMTAAEMAEQEAMFGAEDEYADDEYADEAEPEEDDTYGLPETKAMRLKLGKAKGKAKGKGAKPSTDKLGRRRGEYREELHVRQRDGKFGDKPDELEVRKQRKGRNRQSKRSGEGVHEESKLKGKAKPFGRIDPALSRAHKNQKVVGRKEHLYAERKELEVKEALRKIGESTHVGNHAPSDVTVKIGKTSHSLEVKCSPKGSTTALKMHPDAKLRKVEFIAAEPNRVGHCVFIDGRHEFESGKYKANYSGHELYYKRGSHPYTINSMYKVKDLDELCRLVKMKDADLPPAARDGVKGKPSMPQSEVEWATLRDQAARAKEARQSRDKRRKDAIREARQKLRGGSETTSVVASPKSAKEWARQLTPPQKAAFEDYRGAGHYDINSVLRHGSVPDAPQSRTAKGRANGNAMADAFKSAPKLEKETVAYRGLSRTDTIIPGGLPMSRDAIGMVIVDRGFASTSRSAKVVEKRFLTGSILERRHESAGILRVRMPVGARVVDMDAIATPSHGGAAIGREQEILIMRNSAFKVTGYGKTDAGVHMWDVDYVGSKWDG